MVVLIVGRVQVVIVVILIESDLFILCFIYDNSCDFEY